MAISTPKQPPKSATSSVATGPSVAQAQATTPPVQEVRTLNLRKLGGALAPLALPANQTSEVLTTLLAGLDEAFKGLSSDYEFKLVPVDVNNEPRIALSALVIAMRIRESKNNSWAVHTLFLEATSEPFDPRIENAFGQNIQIDRFASDAADHRAFEVIVEYLRRSLGETATLLDADRMVVPRTLDVKVKDSIYPIAHNASMALSTALAAAQPGWSDVAIAELEKDSTLTAKVEFEQQQFIGVDGLPVRNDLKIEMISGGNTQSQNTLVERTTKVSTIGGYLDVLFAPEEQQQPFGQPPMARKLYAANFVMTSMLCEQAATLGCQLLTLATVNTLRENNAWVPGFRPKPYGGKNDIDLHDVGAIGIEANLEGNPNGYGMRIDTKSENFRPETLGKMLSTLFRPGLVISLDVPECGPESWVNGVFAAAASGDTAASNDIIRAANRLTGNIFGKYFPQGAVVCTDSGNSILLGYYTDRNGDQRDVRDVQCYLGIANLVEGKDPEQIRRYTDTMYNTNSPLAVRLHHRKALLSALIGNVTFTGRARRINFSHAFLDALSKSLVEAGFRLRLKYPVNDGGLAERSTAQFVADSLGQVATTGMFNAGYINPQVNIGGIGRWARG